MIFSEQVLLRSAFAAYNIEPPSNDFVVYGNPITNGYGLYATVYRQKGTNNFIFSFRGTEAPNTLAGLKDWCNNLNNGWPQYREAKERIKHTLDKIFSEHSNAHVALVGHSLGGALAQFTAYDFASSHGGNKNDQITLTTWNALGGGWGLSANIQNYDPNILRGVKGTHYFRFDDVVSRLGGEHLGGRRIMLYDRYEKMEFLLKAHNLEEIEESLMHGRRAERSPNYIYASPSSREYLGAMVASFQNAVDASIDGNGTTEYLDWLKANAKNGLGIRLAIELTVAIDGYLFELKKHELIQTTGTIRQAFERLTETILEMAKHNPALEKETAKEALDTTFKIVSETDKQPPEEANKSRKQAADFLDIVGAKLEEKGSAYGKALREAGKRLVDTGRSLPLYFDNLTAIPGKLIEIGKRGVWGLIERIKKKFMETEEDMKRPTPLALDLDGDGIETLGLDYCIYFDHDGNGFAENTGWIGADDALLVYDRNGNGLVDSGAELFGDHTPISMGRYADNGFEALADLDSNLDGRITWADSAWSRLSIWRDANSNAIAEEGERMSLQEADISALPLSYSINSEMDLNENIHQERGSFIFNDGSSGDMIDVWFANESSDTLDLGIVPISPEIAMLPDLVAGGNLPSLQQAMQRDQSGELVRLVRQWLETPEHLRDALLKPLMYTWAGVADLPDPMLRDLYDLRSLRVLEALHGAPFMNGARLPAIASTPILTGIFDSISRSVGGLLSTYESFPIFLSLVQTQWDSIEEKIAWSFEPALDWLQEPGSNRMSSYFLRNLRYAIESLGDAGDDLLAALRSRIHGSDQASDLPLRWLIDDFLLLGSPGNDVLQPEHTSGATIAAGSGDDLVYALHSNDLIDGGEGNDQLHGGAGNDTYLFRASFGKDTVIEEWNTAHSQDIVVFSDYASTDVASVKSRSGDLVLTFRQGDELSVTRYGSDAYRAQRIDLLRFADGVNWTREDLHPLAARNQASSGDDILGAVIHAASQASSLDGLAGNDLLLGSSHNDQLLGNIGNDALIGGAGDDWLSGGAGTDWLAGGRGRDRYLYRHGDGLDTIAAKIDDAIEERDTIQFEVGISPKDVLVRGDSNSADLVLTIRSAAHQIRIKDFLAGLTPFQARNPIEAVQFADGTCWNVWQLTEQAMQGSEASDWIKGTIHGDLIMGRGGSNRLEGMAGDDVIQGGDGFDELLGGEGNDILSGGLGLNYYITQKGHGEDIIKAELVTSPAQRTGTLMFSDSTKPEDLLFSRIGSDLKIGISSGGGGVTVQQFFRDSTPENAWNPLTTIEFRSSWTVLSTTDILARVGNHSLGTVAGDWLRAAQASSYLHGLAGDDSLHSGEGDDLLDGGPGIDTASYADAQREVHVDLSLSSAQDTRGAGCDTLIAIENLRGSRFGDSLSGSSVSNHLEGGEGDDWLWGSLGADQHSGGPGADRFLYRSAAEVGNRVWGRDWILDFSNEDRLDLSRIDADPTRPGDQAFVWIGDANFSAPGQLRYSLVDGHGLLKGNLEGSSDPEFTVGIRGGFGLDPAVHLLL